MVPRTSIVAIDAAWSAERVLEMTLDTPFSRLPVYEGSIDNVLGILHTRDLVLTHVQHQRPGSVGDLIRPAATVPETMAADQLLRFLREQRTHQALVIDEFGGLAGLVTLEDVLSELLGEVGDEFQPVPGGPERLPDGRIRMPGYLPLADAQRWAGSVWESEAHTIGGHIMQALGRMAVEGDQITIDGIRIEVERLAGRVPGTVLVTPRRPPAERPHG
jgi:CBS domain containing-hemolysin-like protein